MARPGRSPRRKRILDAMERYEIVVIGGGQAGLALGYYLAQQGRSFLILEREHDVAPAWRDRWESLTLSRRGPTTACPAWSSPAIRTATPPAMRCSPTSRAMPP